MEMFDSTIKTRADAAALTPGVPYTSSVYQIQRRQGQPEQDARQSCFTERCFAYCHPRGGETTGAIAQGFDVGYS